MKNDRLKQHDKSGTQAIVVEVLNLDVALVEGKTRKGIPIQGQMVDRRKRQAQVLNQQLVKDGIVIFDSEHFKN